MKLDRLREAYSKAILDGEPMPPDIAALLSAMARNPDFADSDDDPLVHLGCMLILPGDDVPSALSHEYLHDSDRSNKDIMANVAAMNATNAYCCFVASSEDEEVFGYWRGPDKRAISDSPIIMLDTEGQYRHLPGKTLAEALCATVADLPERYERARTCFARLSIDVPPVDAIPQAGWPEGLIRPDELRSQLYRTHLAKSG